MKITYLNHSGFAVELETCVLLFDYCMGNMPEWSENKKIYVFVSHKHRDHFNLDIFKLLSQYKEVHYFLGSDVRLSEKYLERNHIPSAVKEKITNIGKNKKAVFDNLMIQTLKSTDAGVAFIVNAEERCIYHAGDLNWWHWKGEPAPFNEKMEQNYKKEIDSIAGMHFDAAFVPLDPRLEEAYGLGMDYFLEKTKSEKVYPMHMWEEYGYIKKYKKTATGSRYCDCIVNITGPEQEFE